jgi:hypothetical protein
MRTTLNVDDDVLDAAKSLPDIRQISIGQALSELARKGLNAHLRMKRDAVSGFWIFDVPSDAPKITPEDVQRALGAEDLEYAKYLRKP